MGSETESTSQGLTRPRLVPVMVALLLLGAVIATNLVWHHENLLHGASGAALIGCGDDTSFDCDKVNTSDESELLGIPISVFAIPTYIVMAVLALHAMTRRRRESMSHAFAIGLATVLYSLFLFYISPETLFNTSRASLRDIENRRAICLVSSDWRGPQYEAKSIMVTPMRSPRSTS